MVRALLVIVALVATSLPLAGCETGHGDSASSAGCGLEGCRIIAPDPDDADTFGVAIAVDGDTMVTGSIVDDPATDAGAAYVYTLTDGDWLVAQKIQGEDPVPRGGDLFGGAVAIMEDRIAIGAQGSTFDDPNPFNPDIPRAGVVYIFEPNVDGDWEQVQSIRAFDLAQDDFFGVSVAMDDDWLVVGSYLDDDNGSGSGSVYVYEHDGTEYVFDQKLAMSIPSQNDRFGWDVAIDGDILIASSIFDNYFFAGTRAGSVGVFRYDGTDWTEEQPLLGGSFAPGDQFGWAIDIEGETIVASSLLFDGDSEDEGIVFVYRFFEPETGPPNRWTVNEEVERIVPEDVTKQKLFGTSVAIDDGRVIVGARLDDDEGQRAGAAYVFEFIEGDEGEWVQQHKLTAPDATTGDNLGVSVSLSGDNAMVGAPLAGPGNNAQGAAYGFEL